MSAILRNTADRRVQRTRQFIVEAVTRLMFSKGVASVTMVNVANAANVGRSTLYEHFKNKDELLAASIAPLFDALARGCVAIDTDQALLGLVKHFRDGRASARVMLTGRNGVVIARVMTDSFDSSLASLSGGSLSPIKRCLKAQYMAHGTIGVLSEWLSGRASASPEEIVSTLRAFA